MYAFLPTWSAGLSREAALTVQDSRSIAVARDGDWRERLFMPRTLAVLA